MGNFDLKQVISLFVMLLAIIDITGSIPIFLGLKQDGRQINAGKATLVSTVIFFIFFFAGSFILEAFDVRKETFAIAGSAVLFILGIEMVVGVEIMKYDSNGISDASIVPVAFPLIAGPGALTTLLVVNNKFGLINIAVAMLLNMMIAYIVLRYIDVVGRILGNTLVYIIRKFFGVILIAIAIQMFASNLSVFISNLGK